METDSKMCFENYFLFYDSLTLQLRLALNLLWGPLVHLKLMPVLLPQTFKCFAQLGDGLQMTSHDSWEHIWSQVTEGSAEGGSSYKDVCPTVHTTEVWRRVSQDSVER